MRAYCTGPWSLALGAAAILAVVAGASLFAGDGSIWKSEPHSEKDAVDSHATLLDDSKRPLANEKGILSTNNAEYWSGMMKQIISRTKPENENPLLLLNNRRFVLAGLVNDGAEITLNVLRFVVQMNCVHEVATHLLMNQNINAFSTAYARVKDDMYPGKYCPAVNTEGQPAHISAISDRITRLKALRNYQRAKVAENLDSYNLDESVVMLLDLDLVDVPLPSQVLKQAAASIVDGQHDIICSAGAVQTPQSELGYYDIFATVLLPDTFVYPVMGREVRKAWPEEERRFIVREDWTNVDLFNWFLDEGTVENRDAEESPEFEPVPVRTCFGGLALYRASKWLDSRCSYDTKNGPPDMKYANRFDHEACEHVTFANCLRVHYPYLKVAVQPDMTTLWGETSGGRLITNKLRERPDISLPASGSDLAASSAIHPGKDSLAFHPEWHPKERKDRFPSVMERVRLYMSNWYYPPCPGSSSAFAFSYHTLAPSDDDRASLEVDIFRTKQGDDNSPVSVSNVLSSERVSLLDPDRATVSGCAQNKTKNIRRYCEDIEKDFNILVPSKYRSSTSAPPVLLLLSDVQPEALMHESSREYSLPAIAKFRSASRQEDLKAVTMHQEGECVDTRQPLKLHPEYQGHLDQRDSVLKARHLSPIIWKLNSPVHYGKLKDSRKADIPWEHKKNGAVWRGCLSGEWKSELGGAVLSPEEACAKIPRCAFALQHAASSTLDVRLVPRGVSKWEEWVSNMNLMEEEDMSLDEQLEHKILVSIEGNDVSSGLKWMLLSNSVVLMSPPTSTSWAMEEVLEPWVHYVPMDQHGTNAEEMVQWILENDEKAQQIAERATLFIEDLVFHPHAEQDEVDVKNAIMKRYRAHWKGSEGSSVSAASMPSTVERKRRRALVDAETSLTADEQDESPLAWDSVWADDENMLVYDPMSMSMPSTSKSSKGSKSSKSTKKSKSNKSGTKSSKVGGARQQPGGRHLNAEKRHATDENEDESPVAWDSFWVYDYMSMSMPSTSKSSKSSKSTKKSKTNKSGTKSSKHPETGGGRHLNAGETGHPVVDNVARDDDEGKLLNFVVAGFPTSGGTALSYAFSNHKETQLASPETEQCGIIVPDVELNGTLTKLSTKITGHPPTTSSREQIKGIHCPMAIWKAKGIHRLASHLGQMKLIIGVRHPVFLFQSSYNSQVTEMNRLGKRVNVPSPQSLIGWSNSWDDLSTDSTRYELALMQLGKTAISFKDVLKIESMGLGRHLGKSSAKVFLYASEQLEDTNTPRVETFRADMQEFLGLKSPIDPFAPENAVTSVGLTEEHPETIDICDEEYETLRGLLVRQGQRTAEYILHDFTHSSDVVVGGVDYFKGLLQMWQRDPCTPTDVSLAEPAVENSFSRKSLPNRIKQQHMKHTEKVLKDIDFAKASSCGHFKCFFRSKHDQVGHVFTNAFFLLEMLPTSERMLEVMKKGWELANRLEAKYKIKHFLLDPPRVVNIPEDIVSLMNEHSMYHWESGGNGKTQKMFSSESPAVVQSVRVAPTPSLLYGITGQNRARAEEHGLDELLESVENMDVFAQNFEKEMNDTIELLKHEPYLFQDFQVMIDQEGNIYHIDFDRCFEKKFDLTTDELNRHTEVAAKHLSHFQRLVSQKTSVVKITMQ